MTQSETSDSLPDMTFTARIRRNSPVWNLWRQHARTGGTVAGVLFRWIVGNDYVTGTLAPAQVDALKGHASVQMEMAGAAPAAPAVQEPAPAAAPTDRVAAAKALLETPAKAPPAKEAMRMPSSFGRSRGGK